MAKLAGVLAFVFVAVTLIAAPAPALAGSQGDNLGTGVMNTAGLGFVGNCGKGFVREYVKTNEAIPVAGLVLGLVPAALSCGANAAVTAGSGAANLVSAGTVDGVPNAWGSQDPPIKLIK
ncbi:hypothetical protein C4552_03380 [Candidatus Parcubacteria bacterium]|nr:MAG: hypothetical protein C4552_03380 [Candidatus Parcubacteria bacterium]